MGTFIDYLARGKINSFLYRGHHHYIPFNRDLPTAFAINFAVAFLIVCLPLISLNAFLLFLLVSSLGDFLIHRLLLRESRIKALSGLVIDMPILVPLFIETAFRALTFPFANGRINSKTSDLIARHASVEPVSNWYGNVQVNAKEILRPADLADVQAIFRRLDADNRKVRIVGGGLSYSPLIETDDALVDTALLSKLLAVDAVHHTVEVEAGITFSSLAEQLMTVGLQLPAGPEIGDATIGGSIATATHGSNCKMGFFYDLVLGFRLVLANGEVLEVSADKNALLLAAIKNSRGCLGLLYSVTLQVEPYHLSERSEHVIDEAQIACQWQELTGNKNFSVLWWPNLRKAVLVKINESSRTQATWPTRLYFLLRSVLGNQLLLLLASIHSRVVNRAIRTMLALLVSERTMIRPHHELANYVQGKRLFKNLESEWYFPQSRIHEIVSDFGDKYRQRSESLVHYNFCCVYLRPIEAMAANRALLFPQYDDNIVGVMCWVGGHSQRNADYLREVTGYLHELGGYPHSGKIDDWSQSLTQLPHGHQGLSQEQFQQFRNLRQRLDPNGMFINPSIEKLLADG